MRPSNGTDNLENRPRKSSFADSPIYHHPPTTFFLARDTDNIGVSSLQETIDEVASPSLAGRRRSTLRAVNSNKRLRRGSSTSDGALPLNTSPPELSIPGSPSSALRSDDGLTTDDNSSQAIASSEDDELPLSVNIQDSQPELIMPSIKMPSRRPFTERGKQLGRYKILVAGRKGACVEHNFYPYSSLYRRWKDIPHQVYCTSL